MISLLKVTALEKQDSESLPNSCAQTMPSEPWVLRTRHDVLVGQGHFELPGLPCALL